MNITQTSNLKGQNHNSKFKTDIKKRAFLFSIDVIRFVEKLPNKRTYWVISDQLLRSATSIGANIVESTSASSKKDFIKYYEIALKSANETKYWLCIVREINKESKEKIEELLQEAIEISNIIASSLLTMKKKK